MVEILQTLLDAIQGQKVSAAFAFVVIVAILGISGYFIYKFMQSSLLNAPAYVKNKKGKKAELTSGEEWLKSEEGSKYLESLIVTHIKLNDERIAGKVSEKIQKDIKLAIFEETKALYERISFMREEYAGNYVPRKEIENLVEDIDEVRVQVAKIKGHLNID